LFLSELYKEGRVVCVKTKATEAAIAGGCYWFGRHSTVMLIVPRMRSAAGNSRLADCCFIALQAASGTCEAL